MDFLFSKEIIFFKVIVFPVYRNRYYYAQKGTFWYSAMFTSFEGVP